ncbi:LysM peptidoglycan-binding domain-containing protein [Psychrobacillus sp. OK032]|uniref:LysM peptidoglycan-binding domain-containing protein n=1 Tax=Psychrobacillus sp. OK032 TaxID=1884358 RepID=UPI0008D456EB|nr:LysM peptidoglycan-binding domain-containing protein [Psychrobacillus sp. OK032]SER87259.1 LysM domain-containing protein [Psychrobacillus sp. OK032]
MTNPIQFWLKDREGLYLRLPVNPSEFTVTSPYGVSKVNVASLGEVTIPGERGLKTVSFESFFPRDYNPAYCEYSDFMNARSWVLQLETWRDTRKSIRLLITGTNVSIPVLIESFEIQPERAGHVGDIFYSLTAVEYREPSVRKVEKKANVVKAAGASRPTQDKKAPKSHTVKKGDTLWAIAKRTYGNGADFKKIYEANKATIGKNPNVIKPGQKLVLP